MTISSTRAQFRYLPEGFGNRGITIEVAWWSGATPLAARRLRREVIVATKAALDTAGMEIPLLYRTLTFNEPLPISRIDD